MKKKIFVVVVDDGCPINFRLDADIKNIKVIFNIDNLNFQQFQKIYEKNLFIFIMIKRDERLEACHRLKQYRIPYYTIDIRALYIKRWNQESTPENLTIFLNAEKFKDLTIETRFANINQSPRIKVFISHNMSGLNDEEIRNIRDESTQKVIKLLKQKVVYDLKTLCIVEIIDNYNHPYSPLDATNLWHLGRSIQQLGEADYIYFSENSDSRGCLIEREISRLYNIPVLN